MVQIKPPRMSEVQAFRDAALPEYDSDWAYVHIPLDRVDAQSEVYPSAISLFAFFYGDLVSGGQSVDEVVRIKFVYLTRENERPQDRPRPVLVEADTAYWLLGDQREAMNEEELTRVTHDIHVVREQMGTTRFIKTKAPKVG